MKYKTFNFISFFYYKWTNKLYKLRRLGLEPSTKCLSLLKIVEFGLHVGYYVLAWQLKQQVGAVGHTQTLLTWLMSGFGAWWPSLKTHVPFLGNESRKMTVNLKCRGVFALRFEKRKMSQLEFTALFFGFLRAVRENSEACRSCSLWV